MTVAELFFQFDPAVYDTNLASEQLAKINKIVHGDTDTNPWGLPVVHEGAGGRLLGGLQVHMSEDGYNLVMYRISREDLLQGVTIEVEWIDENTY